MRGTPYLSACRQTVSDCGSTPPTAQKSATAPSSTRSERSTSTVKSTWPGVSMMLMRWSSPETGGRSGRDGDAALLLLLHPVHGRSAVMHLAHAVDHARIEQDPLRGRRLARIDVGHDADVAVRSSGKIVEAYSFCLYHLKWANALLASAILWVSSFFLMALPSLVEAAMNSDASLCAMDRSLRAEA